MTSFPVLITLADLDRAELEALARARKRMLAFQTHYNKTASAFDWRYTRADLNAYLKRLASHEPLSPAA